MKRRSFIQSVVAGVCALVGIKPEAAAGNKPAVVPPGFSGDLSTTDGFHGALIVEDGRYDDLNCLLQDSSFGFAGKGPVTAGYKQDLIVRDYYGDERKSYLAGRVHTYFFAEGLEIKFSSVERALSLSDPSQACRNKLLAFVSTSYPSGARVVTEINMVNVMLESVKKIHIRDDGVFLVNPKFVGWGYEADQFFRILPESATSVAAKLLGLEVSKAQS